MYKKICWRWISLSFVLHYVEKWMYIPQFYFLRPNTCTLKHYELLCSNNVNLWKEALDLILRKFHEITIFPLLIWIYLQSIIFIIIKQTQPFIHNSACALILYILTWLSARGWKECNFFNCFQLLSPAQQIINCLYKELKGKNIIHK